MICIDCDTEITGNPVCRATRSAVRWRVPVSSEGIVWSGIRCTAALMIRVRSRSRMIAPSILASSRRPVAVNGTSRSNPPVEIDSTVLSWPSTIRAPVRPRRIRSSPSRRPVPGAIEARVARRRSVSSERSAPTTPFPPVGPVRRPAAGQSRRLTARPRHRHRRSRAPAGRARASRSAEAMSGASITCMPSTRAGESARGPARRVARDHGDPEAEPRGLGQPLGEVADPAQLAGQADLAHGDDARRRGGAGVGRREGDRHRQVAGGLDSRAPPTVETKTSWACRRMPQCCWSTAITIATREESSPDVVRRGRSAALWRDQRLDLGEQRPAALHRHRDAGAGDLLVVVLDEQPGRVGDRRDAVGGRGRSSRPRRSGRTGSSSRAPCGTGSCGRPRSAAPRRRRARARAGRRSSRPW